MPDENQQNGTGPVSAVAGFVVDTLKDGVPASSRLGSPSVSLESLPLAETSLAPPSFNEAMVNAQQGALAYNTLVVHLVSKLDLRHRYYQEWSLSGKANC